MLLIRKLLYAAVPMAMALLGSQSWAQVISKPETTEDSGTATTDEFTNLARDRTGTVLSRSPGASQDTSRTANTGIGRVGERRGKDRVGSMQSPARLQTRLQNRIQNRLRTRIDRTFTRYGTTSTAVDMANETARTPQRRR